MQDILRKQRFGIPDHFMPSAIEIVIISKKLIHKRREYKELKIRIGTNQQ